MRVGKVLLLLFGFFPPILGVTKSDGAGFEPPEGEVVWDAESMELNLKAKTSRSYKIEMTQGAWTLVADEAEADWSEEDRIWNIRGAVKVRGPGSELDGDAAFVKILAKRIRFVELIGEPATFRLQVDQQGDVVQGRAHTIAYDVDASVLRLGGDAKIVSKEYEMANASISYDLIEQRVVADNAEHSGGRVRVRARHSGHPEALWDIH